MQKRSDLLNLTRQESIILLLPLAPSKRGICNSTKLHVSTAGGGIKGGGKAIANHCLWTINIINQLQYIKHKNPARH